MNKDIKLTLNISDESVLDDFCVMAYISKHMRECHLEDRQKYQDLFDLSSERVLSHYIHVCDDFDKHPYERVLINTHEEVWNSEESFNEMYELWIKNIHSLNLNEI